MSTPDESRGLEVMSAGLMGANREPPTEAQAVSEQRNLQIDAHRSKLFSLKMATWADLVIVMDADQKKIMRRDFGLPKRKVLILVDLDPITPERRWVFDPLGHSEDVFHASYEQIDRCLSQLTGVISK